MSGLNNYLRENYMSYLEDGRVCGILNETILQIIKDLEGKMLEWREEALESRKKIEKLRKDLESRNNRIETLLHHRKYLDEKNQELREENERLKKENELLQKDYDWVYKEANRLYNELKEPATMRDPEDESDVGKQLFSVKAKIKHYKTDTNEYHFTNETEFVMAKGWANAAEVFLRNTCLHISEEIIEIEISHKPHIE